MDIASRRDRVVLNKPRGLCIQANGRDGERHIEHLLPGIGGGRILACASTGPRGEW